MEKDEESSLGTPDMDAPLQMKAFPRNVRKGDKHRFKLLCDDKYPHQISYTLGGSIILENHVNIQAEIAASLMGHNRPLPACVAFLLDYREMAVRENAFKRSVFLKHIVPLYEYRDTIRTNRIYKRGNMTKSKLWTPPQVKDAIIVVNEEEACNLLALRHLKG